MLTHSRLRFVICSLLAQSLLAAQPSIPAPAAIDARVAQALAKTEAKGLALAVIDQGKIVYVKAYGVRNSAGEPLQTDTVMYGASLTKTVLAYATLQLVDQGKLNLDRPIGEYLAKPLPEYPSEPKYADWSPLAEDERWRLITPRIVLTHSTGFSNFGFLEPDGKLKIHFTPGSRYGYSGDGIQLLQFAIEKGLGLDVGTLTNRIFTQLEMPRTALQWRADFAGNVADGWNDRGEPKPHDQRSRVRAAGSMDTTIADISKFARALVNGEGLSAASAQALARPILPITTATQFPTRQADAPADKQTKHLHAGLGVIVFTGPQGKGFFKGGHNNITANTLVCLENGKRAVVILANDVRAEAAFAELIQFILGDTVIPYHWEYGDSAGKS
ncbi:serine hydrolase domain-containing protein [Oleiharenicola lentus]|uniref:serine hydrolase domain-containing protein n=1 Tax=Oleiharenicola lentus TaxID=2508720 RepID=UPI003F681793